MIALDTNVLIRYIAQDGGDQARIATQIIEGQLTEANLGYVSLPVVCELVWALQTRYKRTRDEVRNTVALLLSAAQLEIEKADLIRSALSDNRADIADAIIHALGIAKGCSHTVTFDKKFARLGGVELLQ